MSLLAILVVDIASVVDIVFVFQILLRVFPSLFFSSPSFDVCLRSFRHLISSIYSFCVPLAFACHRLSLHHHHFILCMPRLVNVNITFRIMCTCESSFIRSISLSITFSTHCKANCWLYCSLCFCCCCCCATIEVYRMRAFTHSLLSHPARSL